MVVTVFDMFSFLLVFKFRRENQSAINQLESVPPVSEKGTNSKRFFRFFDTQKTLKFVKIFIWPAESVFLNRLKRLRILFNLRKSPIVRPLFPGTAKLLQIDRDIFRVMPAPGHAICGVATLIVRYKIPRKIPWTRPESNQDQFDLQRGQWPPHHTESLFITLF